MSVNNPGGDPAVIDAKIAAQALVVPAAVQSYVSSLVVTNSSLTLLAGESGYVWALADATGRVALGVKADGTVSGKISVAAGTLSAAQFDALTQSRLVPAGTGTQVQPIATEQASTYVYAIGDTNGKVAFGIAPDGTVTMAKFLVPPGAVDTAQLTSAVQSGLGQALPVESGFAWGVVDSTGRVPLGISPDGTVVFAKSNISAYSLRKSEAVGFLAVPFKDTAGKYQFRIHRKSDSQVTLTTSGATNNVEPLITEDAQVIYDSDTTGAMRSYFQPAVGGTVYPTVPLLADGFACWGDSLTAGSGATDGGYPGHLATLFGVTASSQGSPGQGIEGIVARQGGTRALITVTGNSIPASGGVAVTAYTVTPYSGAGATGTLAGVPGTLSNDGSGNLTFTRTAPGSVTACPAATPWVSDTSIALQSNIQILWMGRNSYTTDTPATMVALLQSCVAFMKPYVKRYLVLQIPPFAGTDESGAGAAAQGSGYTKLVAANAAYATAFGSNYVPVADYLRGSALTDLGLTPTSQDTIDIANGLTPTQLRTTAGNTDAGHLNNLGYTAVAMRIQQAIAAKGWN